MAMAKYLHITAAPCGTILGCWDYVGKSLYGMEEGGCLIGQQKKQDHRVKDGWA